MASPPPAKISRMSNPFDLLPDEIILKILNLVTSEDESQREELRSAITIEENSELKINAENYFDLLPDELVLEILS